MLFSGKKPQFAVFGAVFGMSAMTFRPVISRPGCLLCGAASPRTGYAVMSRRGDDSISAFPADVQKCRDPRCSALDFYKSR